MSVLRPQGIETEYGITQRGSSHANFVLLSSLIVQGYVKHTDQPHVVRWDYHGEDPLRDARGFRLDRASADPSMLTDDPNAPAPSPGTSNDGQSDALEITDLGQINTDSRIDLTTINVALANGGRLYVDHAHPEYCTPEVMSPRQAVLWDQAGEQIMRQILQDMNADQGIGLYKNNTDGKGASYGTHENYCVHRGVSFDELAELLIPFFVTRQTICGSGRVGIGQFSEELGFQLAQRSDFMENDIGLETTLRRPIVNTRDEPHADFDSYRRLHVIIGDANTFPISTLIKHGTTALVLWLAERASAGNQVAREAMTALQNLQPVDPVQAVRTVSHDVSLRTQLPLKNGEYLSAVQIQREYYTRISTVLKHDGAALDADTVEILEYWDTVLTALETGRLAEIADKVEWVGKYQVLTAQMRRRGLDFSSPEIQALDLQWSDLSPARSIYQKLAARGAIAEVFTPGEISAATCEAPQNTRARLRADLIRNYPDKIYSVGWKSVVIQTQNGRLQRINLPEPARSNAEDFMDYIDRA